MSHAAFVIPGIDRIGGAEQQAIVRAKGLRRRGWQVSFVALSGNGGSAAAELADAGIPFLSLKMRKGLMDPRGWLRFHRWLRREQPDVVHAHLPHAAWLVRWSRLAAHIPVVIDTLHSTHTGKLGRRIGYVCSRWLPDHVTAVSQATAEAHLEAGMVDPTRLSVLRNCIDANHWRPDAPARLEARQELCIGDDFLWLAVGRLEPVKDYPALLRALAKTLRTTQLNAQLLVLGEGSLQTELNNLAAELGIGQRVRFAGFCSNGLRCMQAADGFVLSSRYEGLPGVLLEAGACGLPTVATDVPGTREVIVDGETGWLTPAGDPERLAATMSRLMQLPVNERRAIGARARRHIVEHFSLKAALDRWEQLYADLLERNNRRSGRAVWESLRRRSAHSA